jgi:hypothetical protein
MVFNNKMFHLEGDAAAFVTALTFSPAEVILILELTVEDISQNCGSG